MNKEEEKEKLFQEGMKQYKAMDYFEAHEAWEDLWSDYYLEDRKFVQGLIQYNSNDRTFSSNIRVSLLKQNNSGLFIVYNDMRNTLQGDFISEDRVLMIKYTHLLRF